MNVLVTHILIASTKLHHPPPIPSDWDGEKAKAREQRSLIDVDPPKPDLRQMTNSEIVIDLPI